MKKRAQFFSSTGLLSTMEDTNAFELDMRPNGILSIMAKQFPDDVVDFIVISAALKDSEEWREICTLYYS